MSVLANQLLKWSFSVSGYSSKLAERLRQWSENIAGSEAKLKIVFDEDNSAINVYYADMKSDESTMWGHFYENAGLFVQNKPQEMKPDVEHIEEEVQDIEFKPSHDSIQKARFELADTADIAPIFRTNIVQKLFGFGQGKTDKQDLMNYIQIGGIVIVLLMLASNL